MKFWSLCFYLFIQFAFGPMGQADTGSASASFDQGVKLFTAGELDKAEQQFLSAMQLDPKNPSILTNLGIIAGKRGEFGRAIGLFSSALNIDPDLSPAEIGLQFSLDRIEVKELPHRLSFIESMNSALISKINPEILIGLIAIISLLFFLRLIDLIKARRLALISEGEIPSPSWILWLSGIVLIFLLILGLGKGLERNERRGVILPKKIAALSAPDSNAVEMFELYEGLQVVINTFQNDWVQVTYPGGQTGWIAKKDVFLILK